MSKYEGIGYKVTQTRQYSEVVYYIPDGRVVTSVSLYDDHLYDDNGPEPLTEDDLDNYEFDYGPQVFHEIKDNA